MTKKYDLLRSGDSIIRVKEEYCDELGILAEESPSYYRFRYFYRKTGNLQNFYISRDDLKNYQISSSLRAV